MNVVGRGYDECVCDVIIINSTPNAYFLYNK